MARKLSFDNQSVMLDAIEVAVLRSPSSPGSSVSLTLDNNSGLANGDYVLLEEIGTGRAEIARINAAVSAGTAIQVDTLLYPHNVGVKIHRLAYNQVKFFRAATVGGAKTELATLAIDADELVTEYIDTDNNTGYLFFALYNSATSDQSDYSSAFPYSLMTLAAKSRIREFVKQWYKSPISEDAFDMALTVAESEVFAVAPWRFREDTFTFNTVAEQAVYPFEDISLTDFGELAYMTYDGQPVDYVHFKESRLMNWMTPVSSAVFVVNIWADAFEFTPAPDAVEEVKIWYWKNEPGFSEETTETAVNMPQVLAFRVLQDLWAMENEKKSAYWERRYLQTIAAMNKKQTKQSVNFQALGRAEVTKRTPYSQIERPEIAI